MAMDQKLTQRLQNYLDTPAARRDLKEGAMLLLKLTGNQIQYRRIMAQLSSMGPFIEQQLKTKLKFRLKNITHEQVTEMRQKVERIAVRHFQFQQENPAKEFKAGKRLDHDTLPEDIQALYVENKSIMQRMRACHAELRVVIRRNTNHTCLDSDMYPFLKELIELDKRYHENWEKYDKYGTQTRNMSREQHAEAVRAGKAALSYIKLTLNKYRKAPSDRLRATLAAKYALVIDPDPALTAALKELKII